MCPVDGSTGATLTYSGDAVKFSKLAVEDIYMSKYLYLNVYISICKVQILWEYRD